MTRWPQDDLWLLQRGPHVRALVRRVDERSERLAGLGAQIVEGDVLDEFRTILEDRGASEHLIQHLLAVAVDYRNGIFAGINDVVKKIGGTDPLDVESFVVQNRAALTCTPPETLRSGHVSSVVGFATAPG
ncbi:hypothetical protein ABT120_55715 [Nonomuraea angiospora]|uniref:hypothetical protein n=1 Tax=Nonomuraea angiospora TaxID=46172 RepID=UPI00331D8DAA